MDSNELNRRDFNRLTMSVFGGALAGSLAGCGEEKPAAPSGKPASATRTEPPRDAETAPKADKEGDSR